VVWTTVTVEPTVENPLPVVEPVNISVEDAEDDAEVLEPVPLVPLLVWEV